jgi:hypothetical protein
LKQNDIIVIPNRDGTLQPTRIDISDEALFGDSANGVTALTLKD